MEPTLIEVGKQRRPAWPSIKKKRVKAPSAKKFIPSSQTNSLNLCICANDQTLQNQQQWPAHQANVELIGYSTEYTLLIEHRFSWDIYGAQAPDQSGILASCQKVTSTREIMSSSTKEMLAAL